MGHHIFFTKGPVYVVGGTPYVSSYYFSEQTFSYTLDTQRVYFQREFSCDKYSPIGWKMISDTNDKSFLSFLGLPFHRLGNLAAVFWANVLSLSRLTQLLGEMEIYLPCLHLLKLRKSRLLIILMHSKTNRIFNDYLTTKYCKCFIIQMFFWILYDSKIKIIKK